MQFILTGLQFILIVKENKIMTYYSNEELINWFKRLEKRNFKNTMLSIITGCFVGFGMFFDCGQQISNHFIFGLSGIIAIISFLIFTYFRTALIAKKTIKEIEITDSNIVFRTFSHNTTIIYTIYEKEKEIKPINFNFFQYEYPLDDTKYKLKRKCFKIVVNDAEFYLLYKYFEDDLEAVIKNAFLMLGAVL